MRLPYQFRRGQPVLRKAKAGTPQELKERVVFEVQRWKKVIRDSNIPQQ